MLGHTTSHYRQKMITNLDVPLKIIACPIVREADLQKVRHHITETLESSPDIIRVDYVEVVGSNDLSNLPVTKGKVLLAAAVHVGKIDSSTTSTWRLYLNYQGIAIVQY